MILDSNFRRFLFSLSYTDEDLLAGTVSETIFDYQVDSANSLAVKYILTPTVDDIFREHQALWNYNRDNVFVAVSEQKSYIINVKEKPDAQSPLRNAVCIRSFDYGVNTIGFEGIVPSEISKQYIDSAFFFDFITKHQRKGQGVDKDLLLNLLQLKSDLITDHNEEIIHLLILRCLFIKYLEDRGIFETDYLLNILKTQESQNLIEAFNEIKKINGDIFKYDSFQASDIQKHYLKQLALFFESDYRSGQQFLFPYQFDRIPIQLISHVYEAFLKDNSKRRKGIYYTPSFLVDFMLKQLFSGKSQANITTARYLDAAVGSGAFLVECFNRIQSAFDRPLTFEEKKNILEQQLFGIDIDRKALQITAFSLYLALLETEKPEFIRHEIKHAHPILPSLIGKTLINANAITDDVFKGLTFEYIVSNPPWGSVPKVEDAQDEQEATEICKERKAISNKGKGDSMFANVSDFERSQAFLLRFREWTGPQTRIAAVVKNSIFLNENAQGFRQELLKQFRLEKFFELSHYNKILFKKRRIGEINGESIELGATEPCAVVIMGDLPSDKMENSRVIYSSPKMSNFAENFEVIHFSSRDTFLIKQEELAANDDYWKVLVNGDFDGFQVIQKLLNQGNICVEARAGFQPKVNMALLGKPDWKKMIEPWDFKQFDSVTLNGLADFNWNQDLHRRRNFNIFESSRIIIPVRPLKSDGLMFKAAFIEDTIVHKDNILSIKLKDEFNREVKDYLPYLAIFNSQLTGFLFYNLSTQWGKGEGKRDTLRNIDVEKLPIRQIDDPLLEANLRKLVNNIQQNKRLEIDYTNELSQLNDLVFDHYGLVEYERQIIKEFYEVHVERADESANRLTVVDMEVYFRTFQSVFSLVLGDETTLSATYNISPNMGAMLCLKLSSEAVEDEFVFGEGQHIINFVKSGQLKKAEALKVLEESKVKLYESDRFYIVKSNQFKDWTVRQAIVDAREEIQQFVQQLV